MKIELDENKVYLNNGSVKKEIHPFWLRERVDGEEFLDKGTQQRLFDPTTLNSKISINTANINDKFLEIDFILTILSLQFKETTSCIAFEFLYIFEDSDSL